MARKKATRAVAPRMRAVAAHYGIRDHFRAIERVREGLKQAMARLPGPTPASGIKVLGHSCCTVNFDSLVAGSWSAETYIFPAQYEALSKMVLAKGEPQTLVRRLLAALRAGKVEINHSPPCSVKLHPEVIMNVRNMLKEKV